MSTEAQNLGYTFSQKKTSMHDPFFIQNFNQDDEKYNYHDNDSLSGISMAESHCSTGKYLKCVNGTKYLW